MYVHDYEIASTLYSKYSVLQMFYNMFYVMILMCAPTLTCQPTVQAVNCVELNKQNHQAQ